MPHSWEELSSWGEEGDSEQAAVTPTTCWRSSSPRPLHKVGLWIAESSTVGLPWSFQLLLNGVQGHGLGSAHIGRDTRDTRHISHRAQKQEQNLDTHFDAQITYIILVHCILKCKYFKDIGAILVTLEFWCCCDNCLKMGGHLTLCTVRMVYCQQSTCGVAWRFEKKSSSS